MPADDLTRTAPRPPEPPPPPRGDGSLFTQLRPLLRRLHFAAGVAVAPFLLVAALTGLAYTATPAVEHVIYAHELRAPVGDQRLPLAEQVDAARAAYPEGVVTAVRVPDAADATTRVVLAVDGLPPDRSRTVFVDPWTGEVRGDLTTFGEWLPVRAWVDELHRTLHLGQVGRVYSELAASWLWVIVGGGLALWIGTRVTAARGQRWTRTLRGAVVPGASGRAGARSRTLAWHGAAGVWLSIGLLGLSATGLTWSHFAGDRIGRLRTAASWQAPVLTTELGGEPTDEGAHAAHLAHEGAALSPGDADALLGSGVGIEGVVAAARGAGLRAPFEVTPPAASASAWTVAETRRVWPVRQDSVAVDGADGAVVDVVRFADLPLGAQLTEWGVDAHMGLLFGPVNLLVLAAIAAGLTVTIVWGYRMWWLRRPRRAGGSRLGAAPPRGAWRATSGPTAAVTALLTLVVALTLPVLGVSLLVFLAVDAAMALAARRSSSGEHASGAPPAVTG